MAELQEVREHTEVLTRRRPTFEPVNMANQTSPVKETNQKNNTYNNIIAMI